jgi:hypothetical protein
MGFGPRPSVFHNLVVMGMLCNMLRYSVGVNGETRLFEIEMSKNPMACPQAANLATRSTRSDSKNFQRCVPFQLTGTGIGEAAGDRRLYSFTGDGDKR